MAALSYTPTHDLTAGAQVRDAEEVIPLWCSWEGGAVCHAEVSINNVEKVIVLHVSSLD